MRDRRTGGQADGRTGVTPSTARGPKPGVARTIAKIVRQFAGMPDYERHIEHLRQCHPDHPIPTERQYYEEFLEARYHEGPTRCC
jgi:uncharacterized short protein YbdD (DUF466 family)